MTTPDSSRERFEKWAAMGYSNARFGPNADEEYLSDDVELCWLAWQEAERGKAEVVEALDSLLGDPSSVRFQEKAWNLLKQLQKGEK